MSITTTGRLIEYPGLGVGGDYAVPFVYWQNSNLRVVHLFGLAPDVASAVLLTEGVDYTLAGGDGATGTATLTKVIAADEILTIERRLPLTQTFDFDLSGSFPTEDAQEVADKTTALVQQVEDVLKIDFDLDGDGDILCPIATVTALQATLVGVDVTRSSFYQFNCTFDIESQVVAGVGLDTAVDLRIHVGPLGTTVDPTLRTQTIFIPRGDPNVVYSFPVSFMFYFFNSLQKFTFSADPRFAACTVHDTSQASFEQYVARI